MHRETSGTVSALAVYLGYLVVGMIGNLATADAQVPESASQDWESRPHLQGVVQLRIGEPLGAPENIFGSIAGIATGNDGRIYVADGQATRVRVYDRNGEFLFDIGRAGQGPGEFLGTFDSPCSPRLEGSQLWLVSRPYWVEVFRIGAEGADHVESIRTPEGEVTCRKPMFTEDGKTGITVIRSGAQKPVAHIYLDSLGEVSHQMAMPEPKSARALGWAHATLPDPNDPGDIEWAFPSPFSPEEITANSPNGGYAHVVTSDYQIQLYDEGGAPIAEIRRDVSGPPLTSEEVAYSRERLDSYRSGMPDVPGANFTGYTIRDRKPPVRDIWFDESGRLWVEVWPGPDHPAARLAHVYDQTPTLLFTAEWDGNIDLSSGVIRGCLGVGTEELEYETSGVTRIHFAAADEQRNGRSVCSDHR